MGEVGGRCGELVGQMTTMVEGARGDVNAGWILHCLRFLATRQDYIRNDETGGTDPSQSGTWLHWTIVDDWDRTGRPVQVLQKEMLVAYIKNLKIMSEYYNTELAEMPQYSPEPEPAVCEGRRNRVKRVKPLPTSAPALAFSVLPMEMIELILVKVTTNCLFALTLVSKYLKCRVIATAETQLIELVNAGRSSLRVTLIGINAIYRLARLSQNRPIVPASFALACNGLLNGYIGREINVDISALEMIYLIFSGNQDAINNLWLKGTGKVDPFFKNAYRDFENILSQDSFGFLYNFLNNCCSYLDHMQQGYPACLRIRHVLMVTNFTLSRKPLGCFREMPKMDAVDCHDSDYEGSVTSDSSDDDLDYGEFPLTVDGEYHPGGVVNFVYETDIDEFLECFHAVDTSCNIKECDVLGCCHKNCGCLDAIDIYAEALEGVKQRWVKRGNFVDRKSFMEEVTNDAQAFLRSSETAHKRQCCPSTHYQRRLNDSLFNWRKEVIAEPKRILEYRGPLSLKLG